jgi:hypothetical protein
VALGVVNSQRKKKRAANTKIAPTAHQNTILGKALSGFAGAAAVGSCMGISTAGIVRGCSIDRPAICLFSSGLIKQARTPNLIQNSNKK